MGRKSNKHSHAKTKVPVSASKKMRSASRAMARSSNQSRGQLSSCVQDYAETLADPFDGPLTCLPSEFPPLPSFKARVWAKGTGGTGVANGFVMVAPQRMAANDAVAVCYSTGGTYLGDGFPTTIADAGCATANSNAQFATAAYGSTAGTAKFRIVGCGLRAWYTGAEVDLSGNILALRHPDNVSLLGLTRANVLAFPSSRRVINTTERNVVSVVYIPVDPTDVTFSSTVAGSYNLGIIFDTKASTANSFAWEAFMVYEVVGQNVPNRSLSHADPEGFSAVLSAAQRKGDTFVGSLAGSAVALLKDAYQEVARMSGPVVKGAVKYAARTGFTAALDYAMPGLGTLANRVSSTLEGDNNPQADNGELIAGRITGPGVIESFHPQKDSAENWSAKNFAPGDGPLVVTNQAAEASRANSLQDKRLSVPNNSVTGNMLDPAFRDSVKSALMAGKDVVRKNPDGTFTIIKN